MADKHDYSEDMFEDTRMSFGDHLEELRLHLWKAISGFLVALFFSFFIGKQVLFLIAAPVTSQLRAYYQTHVEKVEKRIDDDPYLLKANEPRYAKIAFLPYQFPVLRGEKVRKLVQPLPEGELTFASLAEHVHLRIMVAEDALAGDQWDELGAIADEMESIAGRFKNATDVPRRYSVDSVAALLTSRVADLRDAIKSRDRTATDQLLQRIDYGVPLDTVPESDMMHVWIRLDHPVRVALALNPAMDEVEGKFDLSTLSVQEAFMAYFKVCIACGIVIGSPWIFYQIWLFIAAGLYPHEKRLINVYLPFSVGLFLIGVAVCELFVLPRAIEALLWFNEWVGMKPDLRFNEWLGFAIMMPLVFGVSFQLPLVMMFIEKLGIFTVEQFKAQWRIALFIIHIFAALITPSVDLVSMELLALPMFGLYWLGIFLCRFNDHSDFDMDVPDSEEMVEA